MSTLEEPPKAENTPEVSREDIEKIYVGGDPDNIAEIVNSPDEGERVSSRTEIASIFRDEGFVAFSRDEGIDFGDLSHEELKRKYGEYQERSENVDWIDGLAEDDLRRLTVDNSDWLDFYSMQYVGEPIGVDGLRALKNALRAYYERYPEKLSLEEKGDLDKDAVSSDEFGDRLGRKTVEVGSDDDLPSVGLDHWPGDELEEEIDRYIEDDDFAVELSELRAGNVRLEDELEGWVDDFRIEDKDIEAAEERRSRPEGGILGKANRIKSAFLNKLTGFASGAVAWGGDIKVRARVQERLDGAKRLLGRTSEVARESLAGLKSRMFKATEISEAGDGYETPEELPIEEKGVPNEEMLTFAVAEIAVDVEEAKRTKTDAEAKLKELMDNFKEKLEGEKVKDVMKAQEMFDDLIKDKMGDSVELDLKFQRTEFNAKELQQEIDFMLAMNLQIAMADAIERVSTKDSGKIYGKIKNSFSSLMFGRDGEFRQFGSKTPEATKDFFRKILSKEADDLSDSEDLKANAIKRFIAEDLDKK